MQDKMTGMQDTLTEKDNGLVNGLKSLICHSHLDLTAAMDVLAIPEAECGGLSQYD